MEWEVRLRWGRLQVPTAIESNFYAFLCLFTLSTLINNLELPFFSYFSFRYTFFSCFIVCAFVVSVAFTFTCRHKTPVSRLLAPQSGRIMRHERLFQFESIGRATPISFASTAGMRLLPSCPPCCLYTFPPQLELLVLLVCVPWAYHYHMVSHAIPSHAAIG